MKEAADDEEENVVREDPPLNKETKERSDSTRYIFYPSSSYFYFHILKSTIVLLPHIPSSLTTTMASSFTIASISLMETIPQPPPQWHNPISSTSTPLASPSYPCHQYTFIIFPFFTTISSNYSHTNV